MAKAINVVIYTIGVGVILIGLTLAIVQAKPVFAAGEILGSRVSQILNENFVENDPTQAIAAFNREYEATGWQSGGESSVPFLVPAKSVLWGNLSKVRLPDSELLPLFINEQTRIGIYFAQVDVTIPEGRYIRTDLSPCRDMPEWFGFCGGFVDTPASQAAPSSGGYPAQICQDVRNASSPDQAIELLNRTFEGDGYFHGGDFKSGETIPAGSVFWTNFSGRPWNVDDFKPLKNSGTWGAFYAVHNLVANSSGRYLRVSGVC